MGHFPWYRPSPKFRLCSSSQPKERYASNHLQPSPAPPILVLETSHCYCATIWPPGSSVVISPPSGTVFNVAAGFLAPHWGFQPHVAPPRSASTWKHIQGSLMWLGLYRDHRTHFEWRRLESLDELLVPLRVCRACSGGSRTKAETGITTFDCPSLVDLFLRMSLGCTPSPIASCLSRPHLSCDAFRSPKIKL